MFPKWFRPEPWMRRKRLIDRIASGLVRCARCDEVLDLDSGSHFPAQLDQELVCLACYAKEKELPLQLCDECGEAVIPDPDFEVVVPTVLREIDRHLWKRLWAAVRYWKDPWSDTPSYCLYFCGPCARERYAYYKTLDLSVESAYCHGCDRLFLVEQAVGYVDDGYFTCFRCWRERVLREGFYDEDFRDLRCLGPHDEVDLKAAGFVKAAEFHGIDISEAVDHPESIVAIGHLLLGIDGISVVLVSDVDNDALSIWLRGDEQLIQRLIEDLEEPIAVALALLK